MEKKKCYVETDDLSIKNEYEHYKDGSRIWLKEQELYVFTKEDLEAEIAKHYIEGQTNNAHDNWVRPLNYIQSLQLK